MKNFRNIFFAPKKTEDGIILSGDLKSWDEWLETTQKRKQAIEANSDTQNTTNADIDEKNGTADTADTANPTQTTNGSIAARALYNNKNLYVIY